MTSMHHRRWAFPARLCFLLCLMGLDSLSAAEAHAAAALAGVSRELADSRAARLSDHNHALCFELQPHASIIAGQETLTFTDRGTGDLALDYRDGMVSSAQLNGGSIAVAFIDGHLTLPGAKLVHGANELQLRFANFFLGEDTFRNGLRLYLKQHAYANAQWSDPIGAFVQAGQQLGQPHDVQAWILQRGMPQVNVAWTCEGGKISRFSKTQQDVLHTSATWPISNELLLAYPEESQKSLTLAMVINSAETHIQALLGTPCPGYVFANAGDQAYGRFLLDRTSEQAVRHILVPAPTPGAPGLAPETWVPDPLLRTQLWGTRWENVHVAQSVPSSYVNLALKSLPTDTDESLARIQGGRLATALHGYLSDKGGPIYAPKAESVIADRMLHAPTLNLRIVNFRTFTNIAETPQADYLSTTNGIQEDWLSQSLRPFNSWNQAALTGPYLTRALDALPEIKRTRKIFFLGAWLSAFLDGQHSPEAQAVVHAWLAAHTPDSDLRLKVLEASDALDRTVMIRQRFPE